MTRIKDSTKDWMPIGTTLAMIAKQYFGVLTNKLESTKIDRYYSVLLSIHHSGAQVSQQCVANKLMIDKASMVRILDHLSKMELITKEINPENRREYQLSLSAKAIKLIPEIEAAISSLHKHLFKGLNQEEKLLFYTILEKMMVALNSLPSNNYSFEIKPLKKASKYEK
jgi:DNA-binding MarR family transcriptional regulator